MPPLRILIAATVVLVPTHVRVTDALVGHVNEPPVVMVTAAVATPAVSPIVWLVFIVTA
jgi:hypothetical protein